MKELNPFVVHDRTCQKYIIFIHLFSLIRHSEGRTSLRKPWFNSLSSHIQNFFPRIVVKKFFVRNELKGTLWFEMS